MAHQATNRRHILGLGAAGGAVLAMTGSAGPALAQGQAGTLQQIRDRGELRVGAASGEPWFFKDQRSGEWHGIGWGMGEAIGRELGQ